MRATEAKRKLKTIHADDSHRSKRKLKSVHADDSYRS